MTQDIVKNNSDKTTELKVKYNNQRNLWETYKILSCTIIIKGKSFILERNFLAVPKAMQSCYQDGISLNF